VGADGSIVAEYRGSMRAEGSIVADECISAHLESSFNFKCNCLSSFDICIYAHSFLVGNISSSSIISMIFRTFSILKSGAEIIISD
jgi:hypothetical protein